MNYLNEKNATDQHGINNKTTIFERNVPTYHPFQIYFILQKKYLLFLYYINIYYFDMVDSLFNKKYCFKIKYILVHKDLLQKCR